jgi:hypothetical protein
MQPTSNYHKPMHGCAPNCAFLHVLEGEVVWWKWATGRWPWASANGGFHCFLIIGPWLASQGGCRSGMWVSLVGKVVSKSVEAYKWMIVDPRIQGSSTSTFGSNRLKPTVDGHSWGCHLALHESVMWKGQVGHRPTPFGVSQCHLVAFGPPSHLDCF